MNQIAQLFLIFLIAAGAGFVQRISGFGLGIFVMLFLPHIMPEYADAVTLSCLLSCAVTTYNAVKYKKHIPFDIILPMVIAAAVTIPAAVHFSSLIPEKIFGMVLGVVLVCLSIYFMFFNTRISVKPTKTNSLLAGGIGGVLNGLFSTGGPPAVLYLTHAVTQNLEYFAGIQFYFSVINIYTVALRTINGLVSLNLLIYAAIGVCGCLFGDMVGNSVFNKLDANKLKMIIYLGMIISGILMIF